MMLADIGICENVEAPPCSSEDSLAVESPQVFRVYAPCGEVTDAENTNLAGEFEEPFSMSGVLRHVSKYMQILICVKIITHSSMRERGTSIEL